MCDPEAVYPDYVGNPEWAAADHDPNLPAEVQRGLRYERGWGKELIDDWSFWYLGYAITNEQEGMDFVEAYRECAEKGLPFDEDMIVKKGNGTGGSGTLFDGDRGGQAFDSINVRFLHLL